MTTGVHARIKCPMMELSASHTGTQKAVSNLTSVLKHTLLIAVQFMQVWVTHYKTDAFTLLCFQLYGSFLPRPFQREHSKVINGKRKQRKSLWKYFYLACLLIRQTFQGRFVSITITRETDWHFDWNFMLSLLGTAGYNKNLETEFVFVSDVTPREIVWKS